MCPTAASPPSPRTASSRTRPSRNSTTARCFVGPRTPLEARSSLVSSTLFLRVSGWLPLCFRVALSASLFLPFPLSFSLSLSLSLTLFVHCFVLISAPLSSSLFLYWFLCISLSSLLVLLFCLFLCYYDLEAQFGEFIVPVGFLTGRDY